MALYMNIDAIETPPKTEIKILSLHNFGCI